jgi:sulfonate transport system ATP-binding protein
MHQLVLQLWGAHKPAVLMVTHDVDEAIALADRVLVLDKGRIVAEERIVTARGARGDLTHGLRPRLLSVLGGGPLPEESVVPFRDVAAV